MLQNIFIILEENLFSNIKYRNLFGISKNCFAISIFIQQNKTKIIPNISESNYYLHSSKYLSPRIDISRISSHNINRNEKRIGRERVEQAARWRISMKIQRGLKRGGWISREARYVSIKFLVYIRNRAKVYTKPSRKAQRRGILSREWGGGAYDVVRFRFRGPFAIHIPREQYTIEK